MELREREIYFSYRTSSSSSSQATKSHTLTEHEQLFLVMDAQRYLGRLTRVPCKERNFANSNKPINRDRVRIGIEPISLHE